MSTYYAYQPGLYPTALAGPYGTAWGSSQGTMKDRVVTLAVDAVDAGLVLRCPDDALPLLGADVAIEQSLDGDVDAYRRRIAGAWDTWPWAGTETAIRAVAQQFFAASIAIYTARDWPGDPGLWARWWGVVRESDLLHAPAPDGAWDDAGDYDDGGVWDSDASPESVQRIRRGFRLMTNARDAGWARISWGSTDYYDDGGVWDGGEVVSELATTDTWNDDPAFTEWSF